MRSTKGVPQIGRKSGKVSHKKLVFSLPKQLLPKMTKLPTFLE